MPTINFISFEKCKFYILNIKTVEKIKRKGQHTGNPAL